MSSIPQRKAEKGSSNSSSSSGSGGSSGGGSLFGDVVSPLKIIAAGVASFIATGFLLSLITGTPFLSGFWGGLDQFLVWAVIIGAVVYLSIYADNLNTGFLFTLIATFAVASIFLPDWLTQPFSFISEFLFGTPTLGIDPIALAVLLVATTLLFWAIRIKVFRQPKQPKSLVNQMRTQADRLVRNYAKIARALVLFFVTGFFLFASQGGEAIGEVFTMVADAPVVGAYVASTVGYFGAFMSDWPMISRFGTTEFFLVMISLGLVAIGAKYSNALD